MKPLVPIFLLSIAIYCAFLPSAVAKGYMLLLAALVCGLMWTARAE